MMTFNSQKYYSSEVLFRLLTLVCFLFILGCTDKADKTWIQANQGVHDASLSRDGHYALVATPHDNALFWDLKANKRLHTFTHQENEDNKIVLTALSHDGKKALTAEQQIFAWWDALSGTTKRFMRMPEKILSITLSPNGNYALIGLADGKANLVHLDTGYINRIFQHTGGVSSVTLSDDMKYAVTGSRDRTVRVWEIASGKLYRQFVHTEGVTTTAISHDNKYVFSSAGQFEPLVWNVQENTLQHRLKLQGEFLDKIKHANMTVTAAYFSKDGQTLYTGSPPGFLRSWSLETGDRLQQWAVPKRTWFKPPGAIVFAITVTEDGQHAITESSNGFANAFKLNP